MSGKGDDRGSEALMREAAGWFVRMRGPQADASRPAFDAWLAASSEHRAAYNRAAEIFAMGKLLAGDEAPAAPPRRRTGVAAGLIAALAVLALAAVVYGLTRDRGPGHDAVPASSTVVAFRNDAAQVMPRQLADGSRVWLAPGAAIAVAFDTTSRVITLGRGRARFSVAHEERPFMVRAGGATVTARGTLFDVVLAAGRVTVNLIEGVVDVTGPAPGRSTTPVRRLLAGQTAAFAAADPPATPAPAEPSATDPVQPLSDLDADVRDYEDVRVADLVAAANRGAARPIRLVDPAIGQRRVSGRFGIADTDLLAQRLVRLFGLRLDRSDPAQLLIARD